MGEGKPGGYQGPPHGGCAVEMGRGKRPEQNHRVFITPIHVNVSAHGRGTEAWSPEGSWGSPRCGEIQGDLCCLLYIRLYCLNSLQ